MPPEIDPNAETTDLAEGMLVERDVLGINQMVSLNHFPRKLAVSFHQCFYGITDRVLDHEAQFQNSFSQRPQFFIKNGHYPNLPVIYSSVSLF